MTTVTKKIHFAIKGKHKLVMDGPAPEPKEPAGRVPRKEHKKPYPQVKYT